MMGVRSNWKLYIPDLTAGRMLFLISSIALSKGSPVLPGNPFWMGAKLLGSAVKLSKLK